MRYVRVARAAELPSGSRLAREVEGRKIALFNVDGRLFAIENRCAHELMPLDDGELCGTRLFCRWHRWAYELAPRPGDPCFPTVARYPVRVEGGEVLVGLDDTSGASSPGSSIQ